MVIFIEPKQYAELQQLLQFSQAKPAWFMEGKNFEGEVNEAVQNILQEGLIDRYNYAFDEFAVNDVGGITCKAYDESYVDEGGDVLVLDVVAIEGGVD